jgi:hypothetical protein
MSHIAADSATGSDGRTTFSGPVAAGGCVITGGIYMAVQGRIILENDCSDYDIEYITITSPDLNADCAVNLSDLAVFGLSYNRIIGDAGYDPCCDYNDDDKCTLSDFAYLGAHYLH